MRTKLFGAFIAVLALGVLPASAMAAPAQIRSGGVNATIGHTVKLYSTILEFKGDFLVPKCEAISINTEVTTGDELTIIDGSFEPDPCLAASPRIEIRISPNLSGSIRFESEEGTITGTGTAHFTLKVWDRGISRTWPIGLCRYQRRFETYSESGVDELEIVGESDATLQEGSLGQCESSLRVTGSFELQRRDSTPVTVD